MTLGKPLSINIRNLADDAKVTYRSENKKIATVSRKGVVTGRKKGYAGILVSVKQNGQTYRYRIFVRVSNTKKK